MAITENQIDLLLNRIVVATDFTPISDPAVSFARDLARRFAAKLTVANVVDLSVATPSEAALVGLPIETMRRSSVENVEGAVNDLKRTGLRVDGETLEAFDPAVAILQLCDRIDADLLVIGTHARRGLNKMILGSCAEQVIHHARCPVLTVGPIARIAGWQGFSFNTIVFATDLKHDTAEKAAVALAFAQDSIAKIYLCHVLEPTTKGTTDLAEPQRKTEETLRKLIPESSYDWCSPECLVEKGKASQKILEIARDLKADLIVLGAHRNATWLPHFEEGIVGSVIATAGCPVMTICTE
jgi:nucleotide-binding universal stress UspA family protein